MRNQRSTITLSTQVYWGLCFFTIVMGAGIGFCISQILTLKGLI